MGYSIHAKTADIGAISSQLHLGSFDYNGYGNSAFNINKNLDLDSSRVTSIYTNNGTVLPPTFSINWVVKI